MRLKLRRLPNQLNSFSPLCGLTNHEYLLSQADQNDSNHKKYISLPTEKAFGAFSANGGITLEASMTFPLVLMILALFISFFSGQLWQLRLQKALDEIAEDIAVWSHAVDFADDYSQADWLSWVEGGNIGAALGGSEDALQAIWQGEKSLRDEVSLFIKEKASAAVWQQLVKGWLIGKIGRDKLDASRISQGAQGLSLSGSTLRSRELDLVLHYRVVPFFGELFGLSTPVVQRSCRRLWIGTAVEKEEETEEEEKEEEKEEPTVYVTQNGNAYHGSQSCRVFKINPLHVPMASVKNLRSEDGSQYRACERCALGRERQDLVWLTDFGNRYHHEEDCPSLKRLIIPISLSEAQEKYKACGFCGGSHE